VKPLLRTTRRQVLQAGAGGVLGVWLSGFGTGSAAPALEANAEPQAPGAALDRRTLEAEIQRRARWQLRQTRLIVDYYRIGRRIAYPLPLGELAAPQIPIPGLSSYPWGTWLSWTLEERVTGLGWAAEWFGDGDARKAAAADLAALAGWPTYGAHPSLSAAHTGRILCNAATRWTWIGDDLRARVREGCRRLVESVLPVSDKTLGSVESKDDLLRQKTPHGLLHNIRLIATASAALAAGAAEHPAAARLNARVKALFGAVLELRSKGFGEGVGYDGYVLDFIADWLGSLPEPERAALLDHPNLSHYLDQSYMLGAPGAAEEVAELSDVEPRQMPFHLSAQAKLLRLRPDPVRAWLMARCPLDIFRCDALAALREPTSPPAAKVPAPGALDAHYAAVLRTGWNADDLAVAVSCSDSPMGHIQNDSGTLVIGTHGHWLITDPGYQQYVKGDERDFTVGPRAHNAPWINEHAPSQKRPRRIVLEDVGRGVRRVAVDLTACYPAAASLKTLVRHVWLSGRDLVVVADQVQAEKPPQATYHWHAHPAAAWWVQNDWALVSLEGARLWLGSPQARVSAADLQRLPGSRGQVTLVSTLPTAGPVVWWVFALGADRPAVDVSSDGRQIRVLGQAFSV